MRKIAMFGLFFLCLLLVGCNSTTTFFIPTYPFETTTNNHQTTTTSKTTSLTDPYVELDQGDIEKFLETLSQFQAKFQASQQLSVRTTTKTIVHRQSSSVHSESKSSLDLDLNDFYLLTTLYPKADISSNYTMNYLFEKNGQIHRFQHDSEFRILRSVVLDPITQTGMIDLLGQYGLSTGSTWDHLGEVVRMTPFIYEAKIGFPYWEMILGKDNVNFLKTLTGVRLNDQYIRVSLRFNQDYTAFVQQFKLDVQGQLNNQFYRLDLDIITSQTNTPIEKKSVAEMGFRVPVSTTPENIEFDSPLSSEYDIVKNQDNWIRMYLKTGYYNISYPSHADVFFYDDHFQALPHLSPYNRFYISHDGYYYVNMLKTYDFGIMNLKVTFLEYTDVVMKRIGETKTGTITGYSESMYDVNVYTFSSSFKIYLLSVLIDWYATPIHRFDMWLKNGLETCSSPNHQPCLYFLTPHQEVSLSVYTKTPGNFVLHYHLIEAVPTPQSLDEIHDISFYSESKPFYVGWGVERGLFKFSVTEKDSFSIDIRRYIRNVDWSYRIYDLEGNIIKPTGTNVYDLDIGTYVVEVTSVANTIYVPTITARPRP